MSASNGNGKIDETVNRLQRLDADYFKARLERDNEIQSSYASGEQSRMNPLPRGIDPLGSDADSHYRTAHNYFLHVERGRNAVRNHPLVEQGINRLIANLRIDTFQLDVDGGDPALDADQKQDWKMWTGETLAGQSLCDYEGTRNFAELASQSFFSRVSDGDNVHLPLETGQIQTWESHHVRNPFGYRQTNSDQDGIVHGAEVRGGKTVAYWITPFNLQFHQRLGRANQAKRFPVFDKSGNKIVFWNGFRHRFFQRRGISRLSAPRDAMTGFEDLNYANTKSSLRRALISYLMEDSPTAQAVLPGSEGKPIPQAGDRYVKDVGLGLKSVVVEQQGEPAQVYRVPDGKTMTGWNANIPTTAFFEHAALMLTMLSVNLDLPLMFLLLDGSLVNFHGGRMTWDQVKLRMKVLQKREVQGLWGPTYEWRQRLRMTPGHALFDRTFAAAVAKGYNPFAYKFRPMGWPYVKPAEDVAAEDKSESRNLRSLREIIADHGGDLDDHIPQVIGDRASWVRVSLETASRIAKESQAKYGIEIDVLDLARELRYGDQAGEQIIGVQQMAAQQAQSEQQAAMTEQKPEKA